MTNTSGRPAAHSTFVTVVAWIFIVLSGFSTVMSALEYVVMTTVMPMARIQASMDAAKARGEVSPAAEFMFRHMGALVGSLFLLAAIVLIVSIGLLRRRNWARISFIILMALAILWNLGGLMLQHFVLSQMPMAENMPPEFRTQVGAMMSGMQVVSAILAVGFSALFAWIIVRLRSASIRREFIGGT